MVSDPDSIILHTVERCSNCATDLAGQVVDSIARRQVLDLPPMQIEVTKHRAETKKCGCGHVNVASFPATVSRYVQYGTNLRSLVLYLQDYQFLPYNRCRELISNMFGVNISTGTFYNLHTQASEKLAVFEAALKTVLSKSKVVGFDETGRCKH